MKMIKIIPSAKTQWLVMIVIIAAIGVFMLLRYSQSPEIISATVSPEVIVKGQTQQVTVTVVVKPNLFPAPSLKAVMAEQGYPGSPKEQGYKINMDVDKEWIKYFSVFQLNPKTLGYLTNKGKDQEGNLVYTGVFAINSPTAQTVQIQPTNIFGMNLLPSVTPPSTTTQLTRIAITTRPAILPPDPGEVGKATLEGIDSDHDGIRDDVQREIMFLAPESTKKRDALIQIAKVDLHFAADDMPNGIVSVNTTTDDFRASDCLGLNFNMYGGSTSPIYEAAAYEYKISEIAIFNTPQRTNRYEQNSGKQKEPSDPIKDAGYSFKAENPIKCDVDPASLPD